MSVRTDRISLWATPIDLHRPIVAIRLVGSVGARAAADITYHWRFYLNVEKDNKIQSILFDMLPDNETRTANSVPGLLYVAPSDQITTRAPNKVEILVDAVQGATVGMFLGIYMQAGLDQYHFTSEGRGCMWHSRRVVEEMQKAGVVVSGSFERVKNRLKELGEQNSRVALALANTTEGTYGS